MKNDSPTHSVKVAAAGQEIRLDRDQSALIGRRRNADLRVMSPGVSRRHGVVRQGQGTWIYEDAGSRHGSFMGGERIGRIHISSPITLRLGHPENGPEVEIDVVPSQSSGGTAETGERSTGRAEVEQSGGLGERQRTGGPDKPERETITIGRDSDNAVVVPDPLVSRKHAGLHQTRGDKWELIDFGSKNGTYVDGQRIDSTLLSDGKQITFGQSTYRFADGRLEPVHEEAPVVQARDLAVVVGNKHKILDEVSFVLDKDSMLAIVGPTGSGKTTLLRALTGFQQPAKGEIYFYGRDLYAAFDELRRGIGYVPQEETLHHRLKLGRALLFAAVLRLPRDFSREERRQRVQEVLDQLGLSDRETVPINRLSGGQRKRTNIALELITQPRLLFLDEPTSGLDVGFERMLMGSLREIATDGHSVIIVTHTLQSLELTDRVLVLAPGGRSTFYGHPSEMKERLGTSDLAEIFERMHSETEVDLPDAEPPTAAKPAPPPYAPAEHAPPAQIGWWRQFVMLTLRQLAIMFSDARSLIYIVAEVLIPGLLIRALVGENALEPGTEDAVRNARTLLGATAVAAAVIGTANSIREIVKEVPIYLRERAIGLRRSAYLWSKLFFIGSLTVLQVIALAFITTRGAGGPEKSLLVGIPFLELAGVFALAGLAAVALGLLLSAFVSNSEKAMALIPVIFLVQWLLSGIAINLNDKPVLRQIAYGTSANWGLSAAAASVDLCEVARLPDPGEANDEVEPTCDWRWKHEKDLWLLDLGAMGGLTLVAMIGATIVLGRKEPRPSRGLRQRGKKHAQIANDADGPSMTASTRAVK
jgi:ABC-type multidrug transport system ATPase subunit